MHSLMDRVPLALPVLAICMKHWQSQRHTSQHDWQSTSPVEHLIRIIIVRILVKIIFHLANSLAILCSMSGIVSFAQDAATPAAEVPVVAATEFVYPLAVTAQADGVIYVADRNLPGVWKVVNGQKSIYFQGSKKFRTPLNAVRCLAIDHQGKLMRPFHHSVPHWCIPLQPLVLSMAWR